MGNRPTGINFNLSRTELLEMDRDEYLWHLHYLYSKDILVIDKKDQEAIANANDANNNEYYNNMGY